MIKRTYPVTDFEQLTVALTELVKAFKLNDCVKLEPEIVASRILNWFFTRMKIEVV